MYQRYTIGLTGGIGSGKTAATNYFMGIGITVVDADVISRHCVAPGEPALKAICHHFGNAILLQDGHLNRSALREKVFQDEGERLWLEALLHPLINDRILSQINEATSDYVILVSPLLLETEQKNNVDRILLIDVSESTQIKRTMRRDDNSKAQVERIMAAQMSRDERRLLADDVINNDAGLAILHKQLQELHHSYLGRARHKAQKAKDKSA